ncbi:hypothetical protein QR680_012739 [Steinernema hermaphroditum]|uniref:Uncharacterized protein n=1 Tax=Steinernema hermaphroditum TaxID=289476 RepID=A0AA39I520_9BILA|nr:hypothetical protein QR680_012739 [Steinernema hermaphroditum]
MSKKHLELYAPGESTQTRVTEELQSRREARDEDENALVLRLHRQDVAELKGVYEKVDKVIEELKSCRQLEVSFGDLTFLDGRQRVATTGFHNISLYKFKQMSSFEAFVSWYPSTRLEATVIMTDKSSRVRSVPFTKEESALLAELYSSNMEEYEGKFNSASAGSSGSKRIKNDFHEEQRQLQRTVENCVNLCENMNLSSLFLLFAPSPVFPIAFLALFNLLM